MIVCGTDFSPTALEAADVAAHIARRSGEALVLVCATGDRDVVDGSARTSRAVAGETRAASMEREVARLKSLGAAVEGVLESSVPDRVLTTWAKRPETTMLVLGSVGHTFMERLLLGSVADRVTMESSKPVLVVRDRKPWDDWMASERPLRVMVAFDGGASSTRALEWPAWLHRCGPMQLTVCWAVNPALENGRRKVTGEGAGIELLPATRETLWEEFRRGTAAVESLPSHTLHLEPTLGRFDTALTQLATTLEQDVLVVGSHQRHGFQRLWQASVSRGALHSARMSVVVVPLTPGAGE